MLGNRNKLPFNTVILVTTLIFAGASCQNTSTQKPSALPTGQSAQPTPGEQVSPSPKPLVVNFQEKGYILNWDAETESYKDEWTFLYEKPTNPAISVNLTLDENSSCDMGDGYQPCDQSTFTNGDFVELEGSRVGSEVTVVKLRKVDVALPIEP